MRMNRRQDTGELQVVVFTVGSTEFGIPITLVREIIAPSELVTLPEMPAGMVGIINVRGNILPIVDLKTLFAMGNGLAADHTKQRVLLVEIGGSLVGYLVDTVSEVLRISQDSLEQVDRIQGMNRNLVDSICNLEGRLIPIVNAANLLSYQRIQHIEQVAKERTECFVI